MTKHFSSSKTKRWTLQGLMAASIVGLGVTGVMTQFDQDNPVEAAQVEEQTSKSLDADTYYAIERLRSELGLGQRDLSAAGCDTTATNEALIKLLVWYEANKSSLYSARNAVLAARKDIFEAEKTRGDESQSRLQALATALEEARGTLRLVEAQAIVEVETALTESQRQRLAAARANTNITGVLRYVPSLSDTQKQNIAAAQAKRSTTDAVLSAASLSWSQQQELAAIQADATRRHLEVAEGEAAALPVPESVRLEREQVFSDAVPDTE